jgi:hypothetical protein
MAVLAKTPEILLYIGFFAITVYFFLQAADFINGLRYGAFGSGDVFQFLVISLVYMIFFKFVTATLQTGADVVKDSGRRRYR